MRIHEFPSNEAYVNTQKKGSNRRANRRAAANALEIKAITDYLKRDSVQCNPLHGVCHGARCGTEIKLFSDYLPEVDIIGTDLAPRVENVIELDFHLMPKGWERRFDFLYSNSLDHSNRPSECLRVWLDQLKDSGLAFISWSRAHALEGRPLPFPGGDCFGASLYEYIDIIATVGVVKDLLYCSVRGCSIIVIVAARKR